MRMDLDLCPSDSIATGTAQNYLVRFDDMCFWLDFFAFFWNAQGKTGSRYVYLYTHVFIYIYFIVCMQCCSTRSTLIQKNQTWGEILKSNVLKKPSEANPWTGSHQVMIHLFRYVGYVGVELVLGACLFFWGVFAATLNDGHRKKRVTYMSFFFEQVAGSWAQSALRKRYDEWKFVAISNPFMIGKKPRILTKATCKTVHFWMRMERYGKLIHLGVCFWPSKYGLLECTVCIRQAMTYDWWMVTAVNLPGRLKVSKRTVQIIDFDQTTMRSFTHWSSRLGGGFKFTNIFSHRVAT